MTPSEVADLLSVIAACDRRTIGDTDVLTWHGILGDLRLPECKEAVATHFRTSTDFLMPAHLRRIVTASRQDQAMRESRRLTAGTPTLIPMPDWFREEVSRAKAASHTSDGPARFGETIITALDRRGPQRQAVRDYWAEEVQP